MINGGVRICDVCGEVIPNGTTYVMHVLPQDAAELLIDEDHELVPTFSVDADGNVRLDICLDCKANMGIQGEMVNRFREAPLPDGWGVDGAYGYIAVRIGSAESHIPRRRAGSTGRCNTLLIC